MPGGVYRVGIGRSDLTVTLDGVQIKPPLALGSYLAFKKSGKEAMVMGDLVLLQEEVNPVMKKLIEQGMEVTAIHNHLLRAQPAVMYMHYQGHGDAGKLAAAVRSALEESKTPLEAPAKPASAPQIDLDTAAIEKTLGAKGTNNGGVLAFNIPRADTIKAHGSDIPIGARILSVVDCFDALTSNRSYRRPVPVPQAFDLLRAQAGPQYDPQFVRIFIDTIAPPDPNAHSVAHALRRSSTSFRDRSCRCRRLHARLRTVARKRRRASPRLRL